MNKKGMYVSTPKVKAKHEQTPFDVYFQNLEEAYGNLPVPSDDYAGIKDLLVKAFKASKGMNLSDEGAIHMMNMHMDELEHAMDTIRLHYNYVAKALKKEQRYG